MGEENEDMERAAELETIGEEGQNPDAEEGEPKEAEGEEAAAE